MSARPFRRVARNGLAALVVGLARHARGAWLPHRCDACGCLIAPGAGQRHVDWHYEVAMLPWAATSGRGTKPKRPAGYRERVVSR